MKPDFLTPIPFRGGGFAPRMSRGGGAVALIGLIALWQAASGILGISSLFLPSPVAVVSSLYGLVVHGDLLSQVGISVLRIAAGWSL